MFNPFVPVLLLHSGGNRLKVLGERLKKR